MVDNADEKRSISIEVDGKTHRGSYTIDGGWMTVMSEKGTTKRAAVHTFPAAIENQMGSPDGLARVLLHELVEEAQRKGKR